MKNSDMCNEIPAPLYTVLSNSGYILPSSREMTISSILYIEETAMENSETTQFHKNRIKPYRQISSNFPETMISLIVHIEETVTKS